MTSSQDLRRLSALELSVPVPLNLTSEMQRMN